FQRWTGDFNLVRGDPESRDLAVPQAFVEGLARHETRIRTAADDLNHDFKSAYLDYTARRNREEAVYNRTSANIYEVQVHRSSAESERHREASKLFFLGMLGAQAGVTIASLSLA